MRSVLHSMIDMFFTFLFCFVSIKLNARSSNVRLSQLFELRWNDQLYKQLAMTCPKVFCILRKYTHPWRSWAQFQMVWYSKHSAVHAMHIFTFSILQPIILDFGLLSLLNGSKLKTQKTKYHIQQPNIQLN